MRVGMRGSSHCGFGQGVRFRSWQLVRERSQLVVGLWDGILRGNHGSYLGGLGPLGSGLGSGRHRGSGKPCLQGLDGDGVFLVHWFRLRDGLEETEEGVEEVMEERRCWMRAFRVASLDCAT